MSLNLISSADDSTVVTNYIPKEKTDNSFQSEAAMEEKLISDLQKSGYEYLPIKSEEMLINNLRNQLEKLNGYAFTDSEWIQFFNDKIANPNLTIEDKTRLIQKDYIQEFTDFSGFLHNIKFIDKENINRNTMQVINQYVENNGKHQTRYDVTILVNGFPLVHIELKRRDISIRQAFNQIERYQRDSFWAGSGLFEFCQIFVISNGIETKYYSNSTRKNSVNEHKNKSTKKTSNSFKFASFWADAQNRNITDIEDFTATFLQKRTLLNILIKYCVFTADEMLLIMRPYQIVATEKIINHINICNNLNSSGSMSSRGYIWHTTGSGKTLTSFKTAQLLTSLDFIDKVLFVVDRKDLDYQTIKEYDKFEKGAANSNTSTSILKKQLEDPNAKIIVTTIQKLSSFIGKNKNHPVYNKQVVLIFDECHRSTFGEMLERIFKNFKHYYAYGFTGTPIFVENANMNNKITARTTEQIFGKCLHKYTIVNAINDGNVLPFRIDYVNTIKEKESSKNILVSGLNTEQVIDSTGRISAIVEYIINNYAVKTHKDPFVTYHSNKNYFNSILATDTIDSAKKYYLEFKKQIKETGANLKIATIFTYNPNEELLDDIDSSDFSLDGLDQGSRDFLDMAIIAYDEDFHTNFHAKSSNFGDYYKDISKKMKNKEIDILIVVDMFLTGFDSTGLNTIWIDKYLHHHGLIQAFSRTNRILNDIKTFGNIVCFRNLEDETNKALVLFGNSDAHKIILLKDFKSYYEGYNEKNKHHKGYLEIIQELRTKFPLSEYGKVLTNKEKTEFICLFNLLLRSINILSCFDEFKGKEVMVGRELQNYKGIYTAIYSEYMNNQKSDKTSFLNDVEFEIELIKQQDVTIDYILELIKKYKKTKDKEIVIDINSFIMASPVLRNKKELILAFLEVFNLSEDVKARWNSFVDEKKEMDLEEILEKENQFLKEKETREFLNNAFVNKDFTYEGTRFDKLLKPISRFAVNINRNEIKKRIFKELYDFFEIYHDIVN